jgi:hypothetical protein
MSIMVYVYNGKPVPVTVIPFWLGIEWKTDIDIAVIPLFLLDLLYKHDH